MTAWPEGQSSQDLMEVGLIKQDFLSSEMQSQIVECVGMILKDCNLDSICAKNGGPNWSDDSYLNDKDALYMANKADLRFIFQFDSDGMRRLVRKGGVTSFDDLVAYTSLYRPGTLSCFSGDTPIAIKGGTKQIANLKTETDEICYIDNNGDEIYTKNFALWNTGKKNVVKITTKTGKVVICTTDHRFLTSDNTYREIGSMKIGEKVAIRK